MKTTASPNSRRRCFLAFLGPVACVVVALIAQAAGPRALAQDNEPAAAKHDVSSLPVEPPPDKETAATQANPAAPGDPAALAEGKALFRGLCSGCHGGAGRGGKGPDLTDQRWIHGDTDREIAGVIQNGVPRTTMKKLGESLTEEQIAKVVAYIRSLARAPGESTWEPYLSGDPDLGRQLFFDEKGKALCGKCHSVNRKGGRIGPSLDRIASRRSAQYIMESILQPSKDIDPQYEAVQVVTADGNVIKGLRINETNFSLQLREENGRFHSFAKRDLEAFQVLPTSLMPADIAEQLTVKQLHDLFAFLMTLE
jgi:putative heme-binding domain-containing protein